MRYLSLLVFSLFTLGLGAQNISYGLKLGATLSNSDHQVNSTFFPGGEIESATIAKFHAGFWGAFRISEKWQLQPELLWSQQAGADKAQWDAGDRGHTEFNYLAVPVLVCYELLPRLSLAAGPQLSYLLANRIRNEDHGIKENPTLRDEGKWRVGANIELQYLLQDVRFGLRVQRDLTPHISSDLKDFNGDPAGTSRYYHQALHFWVGYALR